MGAVDELNTNQSVLCTKNMGIDRLQLVPPLVIVAIARGAGKVALRYPKSLEGLQDLLGIGLSNGVYKMKLLCQGADSFAYL